MHWFTEGILQSAVVFCVFFNIVNNGDTQLAVGSDCQLVVSSGIIGIGGGEVFFLIDRNGCDAFRRCLGIPVFLATDFHHQKLQMYSQTIISKKIWAGFPFDLLLCCYFKKGKGNGAVFFENK